MVVVKYLNSLFDLSQSTPFPKKTPHDLQVFQQPATFDGVLELGRNPLLADFDM
jgi:hypothetical protein